MPATSTAGVLRMYRLWGGRLYDLTRWAILHGRARAVRSLSLTEGGRVLEVGCGTGLNFGLLRRAVGSSGEVVGLDISPEMLAAAHRRVERTGWTNVRVVEADAEGFELPPPFDGALFSYSMSMIPGWRSAMDCAARHLRPGGVLAVLDFHSMEPLGRTLSGLVRRWLNAWHVDPGRPYCEGLAESVGPPRVEVGPLGWYFVASAGKAPSGRPVEQDA